MAAVDFLGGEPETQRIWQWLQQNKPDYPAETPPWRRPRYPGKLRAITAARFLYSDDSDPVRASIVGLEVYDERHLRRRAIHDTSSGVRALQQMLFNHATRGRLIIFPTGTAADFLLFLRDFGSALVASGIYQITPIVSSYTLKGLRITSGRQCWTLTDWEAATGVDAGRIPLYVPPRLLPSLHKYPALFATWIAARWIQRFLKRHFNVGLGMSIGTTALKAASYHLPENVWKWRPPALLSAMCRAGLGFRGGYVYARAYRGPIHRSDVHRLYTAMLRQPLPLRCAIGTGNGGYAEREGLYLSKVYGHGSLPLLLGVWNSDHGGFDREYWNGRACYCILPSAELSGIRSLGYTVEVLGGYEFLETFSLSGYVDKIQEVIRLYGRVSPESALTKLLGNAVYGKWAAQPEQRDLKYAADLPGKDWWPYITLQGEEVFDLWERKRTVFRHYQHVDCASVVTGAARGFLYTSLSAMLDRGAILAAVDTDCIMADQSPSDVLYQTADEVGTWREEGFDEHAVILGKKAYRFKGDVRVGGGLARRPDAIELLEGAREACVLASDPV